MNLDLLLRHRVLEGGTYSLAPYRIHWWDTETHSLNVIESERYDVRVTEPSPRFAFSLRGAIVLGVSIATVLLIVFLWRYRSQCKRIIQSIFEPVLDDRLNP